MGSGGKGPGGNYAIIKGRKGSPRARSLLTIQVEGERCLPLFTSAEVATEFAILGGLDDDWVVVDDPDSAVVEFLRRVADFGVEKLVLDPPPALKGSSERVSPILIRRFIED